MPIFGSHLEERFDLLTSATAESAFVTEVGIIRWIVLQVYPHAVARLVRRASSSSQLSPSHTPKSCTVWSSEFTAKPI